MPPENDPSKGEIVLYAAKDGHAHVECRLQDETIWLTQQQIADLFGVDKSGVSRHLKNIYDEGELANEATVAIFATVQQEGARNVKRKVEHYNLDAIIAIGYRVNSYQATQFRIWATNTLREFIVKSIRAHPWLLFLQQKSTGYRTIRAKTHYEETSTCFSFGNHCGCHRLRVRHSSPSVG